VICVKVITSGGGCTRCVGTENCVYVFGDLKDSAGAVIGQIRPSCINSASISTNTICPNKITESSLCPADATPATASPVAASAPVAANTPVAAPPPTAASREGTTKAINQVTTETVTAATTQSRNDVPTGTCDKTQNALCPLQGFFYGVVVVLDPSVVDKTAYFKIVTILQPMSGNLVVDAEVKAACCIVMKRSLVTILNAAITDSTRKLSESSFTDCTVTASTQKRDIEQSGTQFITQITTTTEVLENSLGTSTTVTTTGSTPAAPAKAPGKMIDASSTFFAYSVAILALCLFYVLF